MTHPILSTAPSLSESAVRQVQAGRQPQTPGTPRRLQNLNPHPGTGPQPAVRQTSLGSASVPYPGEIGAAADTRGTRHGRKRARGPAAPPPRPTPIFQGRAAAAPRAIQTGEARGCGPERGESRRRAQTRARSPESLPARALPRDRPRPAPWVPVGPPRPCRAHPNLPPTAPPSWRRTAGALLPRGGPPDRRGCPRRRLNRKAARGPLRTAGEARAGGRRTPDFALTHRRRFSRRTFPFE